MSFDTIIKNGTVVDGSGLPKRVADVGIKDGIITDVGRLSGATRTIEADGLVVMPGIVDAHTHYDPQVTFEGHATSSCYHGVTSVIAGNCGYSIAPCKPGDREWVMKLFAQVEGMTPSVLEQGLPWDWESFPQLLNVLDERLGINVGIYVGHSAIRRFVMGEAASEREATDAEIQQMATLVREAMRAGAAGFTSSKSPTHVDHLKRPVPSRKASFQEIKTLAAVAGEGGAGSIGYLAETAVQGYVVEDRQRIVELALASGLPVVVQGMGYRPGAKERWDDQVGFLGDARAKGAAVYSMLRTQPFMRPFNWRRGTSLFEGCFSWRELGDMTPDQRVAAFKDESFRKKLAADWDAPNTDSKRGSTLPPPRQTQVFVDKSKSNPAAESKHLTELATAKGMHPATVMCELVVADNGETQFVYNSEGPEWIAANGESQRNPHMIVGTGDGGAHADRDDGAEWSTYFLRSWVLDRQHYSLEEGVRRITHLPAMICGIPLRGLIARGYHADVMLFDPAKLRLGKKGLVNDMPGGEARWLVKPEGIVRVIVNGETIVENGELRPATPGRVLRIGERRVKAAVYFGDGKPVAIEDVRVKDPGHGEVRVAIKAAGLCHSDVSVLDGTIPYPVPVVLGHEGAGVVEAIGSGVTSVKPGDVVILSTLAHCGRCIACESSRPTQCRNAPSPKDSVPFFVGGKPAFQFANTSTFTELTTVREQSAIPFDPRVPFDRACLIGCGIMTGVGAVLNRARVEPGASMVVIGVGGIGLNCVQGGVLAGASRIIAVDVNPQKLALAKQFGATDVIDGSKENTLEKVRDLTKGGADYAFECVGNLALIQTALDATGPGGTMVVVGVPKLGSKFEFPVHTIYNNKAILGCRYGAARPRKDFAMLADLYLAGRLKIDELITEHYALDDFQKALDDLHHGHLARGVFQF